MTGAVAPGGGHLVNGWVRALRRITFRLITKRLDLHRNLNLLPVLRGQLARSLDHDRSRRPENVQARQRSGWFPSRSRSWIADQSPKRGERLVTLRSLTSAPFLDSRTVLSRNEARTCRDCRKSGNLITSRPGSWGHVGCGAGKGGSVVNDPDRDSGRSVRFVGDLDDAWVASIANALPAATERVHCAGDLPESVLNPVRSPDVLVTHRAILTRTDADGLARLRSEGTRPWVVLCHGPHVRYADLDRWAGLFDAAVPEATAPETIRRRLGPLTDSIDRPSTIGPRPRIAVVSANVAIRQMLAEVSEGAGYPISTARDLDEVAASLPVVWDLPLLEPDWSLRLAHRNSTSPLIALLGFADRAIVTEAKSNGASACLELPVDLGDLIAVLDRLTSSRGEPPHDLPPSPVSRRRQGVGTGGGRIGARRLE